MSISQLRVAAVGITPPGFKASGGISAGIQLTQRIAKLCDAQFIMMSNEDSLSKEDGLRILRRRSKNIFGPFQAILPRGLVSTMWRPALRKWLASERPT